MEIATSVSFRSPMDLPYALSIAEAAEFLRVSQATIYRWIKAGKVRRVKLGAKNLIPRDEIVRAFAAPSGVFS